MISPPETRLGHHVAKRDISAETSPFSSPPSTPDADADESPPALPTRPRPQEASQHLPSLGGFEPPPIHYAVAGKRRAPGPDPSGMVRSRPLTATAHDPRVGTPARPATTQALHNEGVAKETSAHAMLPPPRPPRPATQQAPPNAFPPSTAGQPKRVSSTPTTQTPAPPQSRPHGRSNTVDRMSDRAPIEIRTSAPRPSLPPSQSATPLSTSPAKLSTVLDTHPAPSHQGSVFPDGTNTNRRPPFIKKGAYDILTKYDARIMDVCGEYACTSGQLTRIWNFVTGEMIMSLAHTEGIRPTSVIFKSALSPQDDGSKIWIGTSGGELMEIDTATHAITPSKPNVHGRFEVIKMYRHFQDIWTLDEAGTLHVWGPSADGLPSLGKMPSQTFKTPRGHTFSMVVGDELWHATGKEVRVFAPTLDGRLQFQVLIRPLIAEGAGEVTSGSLVRTHQGVAFFGHADGKVSAFSTEDYSCLAVLSISAYRFTALVGVGQYMWAAYSSGKMCVYEIGEAPWTCLKEWQAHENHVVSIKCDSTSAFKLDQLQVVSLGGDNRIRVWDGLLQDDWLEDEMKSKDTSYCDFDEIKALVLTWNAGASTPHSLRYSGEDETFFQDLLLSSGSPDILVFGFQELVDLEDKTATAKRLFKGKKKEGPDQERMSHQYRDWRDYLMKTLDDCMPADDLYHLLLSAPLVGLFTCIFVRSSLRARIGNLTASEVKRGMGGVYGNKGAVAIRFCVDDSSLCFVNCHLAAGQSQANSRHIDIAAILEASLFPAERDVDLRIDNFAGGGDGSLIVDHELCIVGGDLNYRIDTMSRDTVIGAIKQGNLTKLLDRDQLLVARRRNPAFKLRAFEELLITFAPTYKYDVGTNSYDTSEKRRSPAWCDRLLFKGRGRVQQLDYQRHEVRVSDHRPVTGNFRLWVKKIKPRERAKAWMETQQRFDDVRLREIADEK